MHGMPSSRATLAACDVRPPTSVTIPAARTITDMRSGVVRSATRTYGGVRSPIGTPPDTTTARPAALPGLATTPDNNLLAPFDEVQSAPETRRIHVGEALRWPARGRNGRQSPFDRTPPRR